MHDAGVNCSFLSCRAGLFNRCDERQVLGVSVPAFKKHGAFAEFVTMPAHILYRIPDNVSFEQALQAILGYGFKYDQDGNFIRVYKYHCSFDYRF